MSQVNILDSSNYRRILNLKKASALLDMENIAQDEDD